MKLKFLLFLFLSLSFWTQADSSENKKIIIGVNEFAPCVMKTNTGYTGLDIDVWEELARRLKISPDEYEYKKYPFGDLLSNVASGKADVGMAGISITYEREKKVDFTHHYLNSNLKILVNSKDQNFFVLQEFILRMLKPLVYLFLFVVICGHFLWFAERGKNAINDTYFPGVFEGMWLTVTTMTTVGYGDYAPNRWSGRCVSSVIMVVGISFYGWAIANMTNILEEKSSLESLTLKELNKSIVATKGNSTSEKFLKDKGINALSYDNIDGVMNSLFLGKSDAIVLDEATLRYIVRESRNSNLQILNEELSEQSYGFALAPKSELKEKINQCLLQMKEDGTLERIQQKWL